MVHNRTSDQQHLATTPLLHRNPLPNIRLLLLLTFLPPRTGNLAAVILARSSMRNPGCGRSVAGEERGGNEGAGRGWAGEDRTRARDTRDRSRYDISRANSPVRGFSLTPRVSNKGVPSTNRESLSVPIEDPETTETTLARADARLPSSSMRAHIHTFSLFLSLSFSFLHSLRVHGACASRWNGADALSSCSLVDPYSLIHAFRHAREPRCSLVRCRVPTVVSPA